MSRSRQQSGTERDLNRQPSLPSELQWPEVSMRWIHFLFPPPRPLFIGCPGSQSSEFPAAAPPVRNEADAICLLLQPNWLPCCIFVAPCAAASRPSLVKGCGRCARSLAQVPLLIAGIGEPRPEERENKGGAGRTVVGRGDESRGGAKWRVVSVAIRSLAAPRPTHSPTPCTALAVPAAHLAADHNKAAQLIRARSEGGSWRGGGE